MHCCWPPSCEAARSVHARLSRRRLRGRLNVHFRRPRQKRGPHRAAAVMGALEYPVERQPRVKIVGATRNEFLRAEETGSAPADGISISVKRHRATRPVTTGARDRSRNRVARVGRVAGLHGVSRAVRIGYCTADDGAGHHASGDADTDSAAPTARFRRRRCQYGNCQRCGSSKCEHSLVLVVSCVSRLSRSPPSAPNKSRLGI